MSEDAGIRLANIAAYRVLVNKNEAKRDNTLQSDRGAAPISPEGVDHLPSCPEHWMLMFHTRKTVLD